MVFSGLFGSPDVEKLIENNDVNGLIKVVRSKKVDYYSRPRAIKALGSSGDPKAIELLIAVLKENSHFTNNEINVAVEALSKIGAPVVEPLIFALKNMNFETDSFLPIDKTLDKIGAPAVEPLIAALNDSNSQVRQIAIYALGRTGDPRSVEPLIIALKDSEFLIRKNAAEALGKIGDPRSVDPLIISLKDSNTDVRKNAAEALGKIGDPRSVDPLIISLKDSNTDVRRNAAEALDRLKWSPKNDDESIHYWISNQSMGKCIELGDPAIGPLKAVALNDPEPFIRKMAVEALERISTPRSRAALNNYHNRERNVVTKPLVGRVNLNSVRCSNCKKELKSIVHTSHILGPISSVQGMEQWRGNVCMECHLIFCPDCIKVGYPTPCPKCGTPTKPALRGYLENF